MEEEQETSRDVDVDKVGHELIVGPHSTTSLPGSDSDQPRPPCHMAICGVSTTVASDGLSH